jgi:hypothetical protein
VIWVHGRVGHGQAANPRIAGFNGRIQFASGPGWLNCVSVAGLAEQARICGPAGFSLAWKALAGLRPALSRSNAGGPRLFTLGRGGSRCAPFPAGAGLPEMTKKAFAWTVYCSPVTAPKTSKPV